MISVAIFCLASFPIITEAENLFFTEELSKNSEVVQREDFIITTLNTVGVNESSNILIAPRIAFNYGNLGLQYKNMHYIFLGLDPYHLKREAHEEKWAKLRRIQEKIKWSNLKIKPFYEKDLVIINSSFLETMSLYLENYTLIASRKGVYIYEKN